MEISAGPPDVSHRDPDPFSPGAHSFRLGGITQRYHVYGNGPVCVAHPGGPGLFWDYLRMPALEKYLTMVYVEPIGTGESGRLPSHPHGYTQDRYSRFLQVLINRLCVTEVYLLGHAHGAHVAAHHARYRAERLAGVILYDARPARDPGDSHKDLRRSAPACDDRRAVSISGLDEYLSPAAVDDHVDLEGVLVPKLVIPEGHVRDRSGRLAHVEEPLWFSRTVREFVLATTGSAATALV
jgi:pimeloyl-ACP methyl ester carboxylesterase